MNPHTLDACLLFCLLNVPADHWAAAWPPESTVVVRMASKATRDAVDTMLLPVAVTCSRRTFADSGYNMCYNQLRLLSSVCLVTTLKLIDCLKQGEVLTSIAPLAAVLPQCRGLEHLDLSFNCIGTAGLYMLQAPIAGCAGLTKLVMSGNCFGDEGATCLAEVITRLPALEYLDVARNSISRDGITSIAQALPHCPRLSVLLLGHNRTANAVDSLAVVLPLCPALTLIDVSHTGLGMEGLMIMYCALPHLRFVQIHAVGNPKIDNVACSNVLTRIHALFSREH